MITNPPDKDGNFRGGYLIVVIATITFIIGIVRASDRSELVGFLLIFFVASALHLFAWRHEIKERLHR
jgi:hypothetical protein